ncbi:hypothetical protein RVY71_14035 [Emergencia timonensis]|uniref:hypothetical protein n=1 Tax=Emergencia timonensis TaxID=1776384 RepID=UPI00295A972F|nr:hypothetical protein [Emergencia timonensis]WNX87334.1 hypothetical protein RVY71_14035 [Emergencia timonensis]
MPQEVASCLSEEDIDNLGGARSFQQLKPYSQFGDADTKVVAVSGMTDYGQFVTVVWFSRKNEKRFSRDVLTIQGEVSSVYKGKDHLYPGRRQQDGTGYRCFGNRESANSRICG